MIVKIDLNSLVPNGKLNGELWKNSQLRPEVRKTLLRVAEDFFDDLDIPWAELEDIRLTGSSANYNWSKYSDIDVHLIVDYSLVDKNEDFAEAYFTARKNLWNNEHDISISGYDVEVYVEDPDAKHTSSGIYSIMMDEWIKKPKLNKSRIDKRAIKDKSNTIMRLINDLIVDKLKEKDYTGAIRSAEKMSEKLKKMRKTGLDTRGEYSTENLTYKILRRNGYLQKLWDAKIDAYDQMMTME